MNLTTFDNQVKLGRNKIISLYAYYTQELGNLTPSESAELLTTKAIEYGYISQRAPILGRTLTSWSSNSDKQKVPLWAVNTSLMILLRDYKWFPEGEIQLCCTASALYGLYGSEDEVIEEFFKKKKCDRDLMSLYLCLAKQSREAYLARKSGF